MTRAVYRVHFRRSPPQRNFLCEAPYLSYDRVCDVKVSRDPARVTCRACLRRLITMGKLPSTFLPPLPPRVRRPALAWTPGTVPGGMGHFARVGKLQLEETGTAARGMCQWTLRSSWNLTTGLAVAAQVAAEDAIVEAARVILAKRRRRA